MSETAKLYNLCIICLNTETLTPIPQLEYQEVPAETLLKDSNLIKFENDDLNNRSLCRKCCVLLYRFHCMRNQFFENQEKLQSILKNETDIKNLKILKINQPIPSKCIDCVCSNVTVSNLPTICRICFKQVDIYPIGNLTIEGKSAIQLLEEFSNQNIKSNEMLCLTCLDHLLDISNFRNKFENHDFIAHNLQIGETNLKLDPDQMNYELIEEKLEIVLNEFSNNEAQTKTPNKDKHTPQTIKRGTRDASLTYKIVCRHCSLTFDTKAEFTQHTSKTKTHTSFRTKIECVACNRLLCNATAYRAHVDIIHRRVQAFECATCARRFSLKRNLARHAMTHTNERPFVCERCGLAYIQKASLAAHIRSRHEAARHACAACGRAFATRLLLQRHARTHAARREFVCETCGRAYAHKSALYTHRLTHGEKARACAVCDKRFHLRSKLAVHMRAHTGERPFACGVCAKAFKARPELRCHMETHSPTRRFRCEVCGRGFRQAPHLAHHRRMHAGVKPCACKVCGKRFTCPANLREHARIHTGEKPFKCGDCFKLFRTSGALRKHMRMHVVKCEDVDI